jgi:hypothetical protein
LTLAVAMTRLLPHPHNFTPVGAMALFGGACFARRWTAFAVPLAALVISDLALAATIYRFDQLLYMPPVYLSFTLIVCIGMLLRGRMRVTTVVAAAIGAAVLHALITDFAVWAFQGFYPKTFAGLVACYTAGLPYFQNMLAANLVFCGVLFGSFAWAQRRFPTLQEQYAVVPQSSNPRAEGNGC